MGTLDPTVVMHPRFVWTLLLAVCTFQFSSPRDGEWVATAPAGNADETATTPSAAIHRPGASTSQDVLARPARTEPSMEVVEPRKLTSRDLLLAAPHDGYDLRTGEIASAVARELGARAVIAHEYRDTRAGRYFNVNRPTECALDSAGKPGEERETEAARRVFTEWCDIVAGACKPPVGLYVEIHGHVRQIVVDGERVTLDVVEVATVGFARAELERLATRWRKLQEHDQRLPRLVFDILEPSYEFRGVETKFHFEAEAARSRGILDPRWVKRALHVELPASARTDDAGRKAAVVALTELVARSP